MIYLLCQVGTDSSTTQFFRLQRRAAAIDSVYPHTHTYTVYTCILTEQKSHESDGQKNIAANKVGRARQI